MRRGWVWRAGGGKPAEHLTTEQQVAMLPLGFAWVLAAFAMVCWYTACLTFISPVPGNHRHFDVGVLGYLVVTNGMLVGFLVVKWREHRANAGKPQVRDFGD